MCARSLLCAILTLMLSRLSFAAPVTNCTHETLKVKNTPIHITYCAPPVRADASGRTVILALRESFSSRKGAFAQTSNLEFLAGDEPSRVIEDVALEKLGLDVTLHLTLVLRRGAVAIEGAILTPGAITLK
ncbi:MAG: hypothetical protein NVSMB31_16000 [Vulcanimicrobiaceae bacterium]